MAWLLIPVCVESSAANFGKKMSAKSVYSQGTLVRALSVFRWVI